MRGHHDIEREGSAMAEMKEFAGLYYRDGALDPKTMQLVALAAMAAAGCTS
jgi:alkylhydroperoxidase/carboxymuconolactone decarboxylase family protein YurZ